MMNLDRLNLTIGDIAGVAYMLNDLGEAFALTGNEKMADRMEELSNMLLNSLPIIREFEGEAANALADTARVEADNMLAMGLAMISETKGAT